MKPELLKEIAESILVAYDKWEETGDREMLDEQEKRFKRLYEQQDLFEHLQRMQRAARAQLEHETGVGTVQVDEEWRRFYMDKIK